MKGLLLKDIYTLAKQMRFFLLMVVFMAAVPGGQTVPFAIMYSAMLPYTALAYDERSHWNDFARMMPYTTRQMVASKFALGWMSIGCAVLLSAVGAGFTAFADRQRGLEVLMTLPILASIAAIIMAVTLTLMFRYGVEKGRMLLMVLLVFSALGAASLTDGLTLPGAPLNEQTLLLALLAGLPVLAVLVQFVTIPLAEKAMQAQRS